MDIDKELRRIVKALLKRPPLRRGPWHITDEELRTYGQLSKEVEK